MQVVYEAGHVIDAHLVRHALERAGIPAFVRGEALLGALGEVGVYGLVAVCVPDPCWPQARALVEGLGFGSPPDPAPAHAPGLLPLPA